MADKGWGLDNKANGWMINYFKMIVINELEMSGVMSHEEEMPTEPFRRTAIIVCKEA